MNLSSYTQNVIFSLSVLTVLGQVICCVLVAVLAYEFLSKRRTLLTAWISRHALLLMLIVALAATLGSLFFSEIAGWTPCKDCWLQRIFMYPQAVILLVALWKRDSKIAPYILVLSLIGILLSVSHYTEQVQAAFQAAAESATDPMVPCDTTGVSCAKTEIHFTFGYITIPMMALTAFLLNGFGSFLLMRKKGV